MGWGNYVYGVSWDRSNLRRLSQLHSPQPLLSLSKVSQFGHSIVRPLYLREKGRAYGVVISNGLVSLPWFSLGLSFADKDGLALSETPRQALTGTTHSWHRLLLLLRKTGHAENTGGGW